MTTLRVAEWPAVGLKRLPHAERDKLPDHPVLSAIKWSGYEQSTLQSVFSALQDPEDWKAPIEVVVRTWVDEVPPVQELIWAAVQWFTGSEAQIAHRGTGDANWIELIVTAPGYRAGPAGDH